MVLVDLAAWQLATAKNWIMELNQNQFASSIPDTQAQA